MVPSPAGRGLGLRASVLDGHGVVAVHAVLLHRYAVQVAFVAGAGAVGVAELLAGVVHGLVHSVSSNVRSLCVSRIRRPTIGN